MINTRTHTFTHACVCMHASISGNGTEENIFEEVFFKEDLKEWWTEQLEPGKRKSADHRTFLRKYSKHFHIWQMCYTQICAYMHLLTLANKDISKHTFKDQQQQNLWRTFHFSTTVTLQQQKIYERHFTFQQVTLQQHKIYESHSTFQQQSHSKVVKMFSLRSKGWQKLQQQQKIQKRERIKIKVTSFFF